MNRFPFVATHPRGRFGLRLGLASISVALVTTACSSGGSSGSGKPDAAARPATRTVSAASLASGDPVPAPAGKTVMRLFGKIATTNGEDGLTLDVATIERLGTVSFEVYEPYEKQRMRFQGVPFAQVLDLARLDASAQQIHMVALDDYVTDLSLEAARTDGLMLATRSGDGSLLPVEDGGPTRLVFLDGTPGAENLNDWIWSIATVEVR